MVSTLDEVLDFINNLGFKRIDEFPDVPSLNMSDTIIVVDNTQHIVGKVNADALMQFLNKNLRNFIMWKPVVTNSTLSWERSNDDTPPESIRFDQILFPMADAENDGMITSAMYITLANTDFENIVYKAYLEKQLATKANAIHEHDQYALKDQIPSKLSELENDTEYANVADIPINISAFNNDSKYLTEDTLPEASSTNRGTLSAAMFKYISDLPNVLSDKSDVGHTHDQYALKDQIPSKLSELENDGDFITKNTLVIPIATSSVTGGFTIQSDSALILNGSDIDIKHFEVRNMVRNSTFSKLDGASIDSWSVYPSDASVNFQNVNDPAIGYHAKIIASGGLGIYETLDDYGDDISTLTVAFYARTDSDTDTSINIVIGNASQTVKLTKEWQTYVLHFDNAESSNVFKILISEDIDIGTAYITKCHVQSGPIYTGWQPNRNETISSIESIPTASTNVAGVVKVDGITTVMKDGVLHAVFKDSEGRSFASIDDVNISTTSTYSSSKINTLITNIQNTCNDLNSTLSNIIDMVNQHTDLITNNSNDIAKLKKSAVCGLEYSNDKLTSYDYDGTVISEFEIGGGTGVILKKTVVPTEAVSEIDIPTELTDKNNIVVYYDGIMMEENVNYTIVDSKLVAIGFAFKANSVITFIGSNVNAAISLNTSAEQVTLADPDDLFDGAQSVQGGMTVLANKIKNGGSSGNTIVKKTVLIETDGITVVDIPSEITNDSNLNVYYDGILLTESVNYTRSDTQITLTGFTTKKGIVMTFVGSSLDKAIVINKYADNVMLQNSEKFGGNNSVQSGMEYLSNQISKKANVQLLVDNWEDNSQTVDVSVVTSTNDVFVNPSTESQDSYTQHCVKCTTQGDGILVFTCQSIPETNLTINIITL